MRRWISLSDAAVRASLNRERLLRLVQCRLVEGRRNLTGRWEVESTSLRRYVSDKEAGAATAPSAVAPAS